MFGRNAKWVAVAIAALAAVGIRGNASMADTDALKALRSEAKFQPSPMYTGVDTPEDGPPLTKAVNDALDEVISWPSPIDTDQLRKRLKKLADDVNEFATEDRDETYRYAIRIWRAAGFTNETNLFNRHDDEVLWPWERRKR